jgi:hypothetical protein
MSDFAFSVEKAPGHLDVNTVILILVLFAGSYCQAQVDRGYNRFLVGIRQRISSSLGRRLTMPRSTLASRWPESSSFSRPQALLFACFKNEV